MDRPDPYDHLSPADGDYPAGVYRVVGRGDDGVVLLRVADADGNRVHGGELLAPDAEALERFEPAGNPDRGQSVLAPAAASPSTAYWSVRTFLREARERPLVTLLALAALAVGSLGGSALPLGAPALAALVLLGGLGLAAVGSGRL